MEVETKTFKKSPPTTCEYWINGNCLNGDECLNLHWWVNTNDNGKVSFFILFFLFINMLIHRDNQPTFIYLLYYYIL